MPKGTIRLHTVTLPRDGGPAATAGDAMAVVDASGDVTGWSEGARLLTGYTAEDVTGRPSSSPPVTFRRCRRRAWAATGST
ncbi:PAS domain-containing protein [Streptomyces phaeochromogenes]